MLISFQCDFLTQKKGKELIIPFVHFVLIHVIYVRIFDILGS